MQGRQAILSKKLGARMKHEIPQLLWLRDVWTVSVILAGTLSLQEFSPLAKWELSQPRAFPTPSDGVG